jgi:hypothetical protein
VSTHSKSPFQESKQNVTEEVDLPKEYKEAWNDPFTRRSLAYYILNPHSHDPWRSPTEFRAFMVGYILEDMKGVPVYMVSLRDFIKGVGPYPIETPPLVAAIKVALTDPDMCWLPEAVWGLPIRWTLSEVRVLDLPVLRLIQNCRQVQNYELFLAMAKNRFKGLPPELVCSIFDFLFSTRSKKKVKQHMRSVLLRLKE